MMATTSPGFACPLTLCRISFFLIVYASDDHSRLVGSRPCARNPNLGVKSSMSPAAAASSAAVLA